ncbi:MAG: GerMN domain-containing protein [Spirochaetia bacterium]|jgi:germination protein M|nr:GerMN domain-containing protein [Spirochaetia bacterium]
MKKKKSSIGCLFWIALILLLLVVFLFSRSRIENVMESTGFLKFLSSNKTVEEPEVERVVTGEDDIELVIEKSTDTNEPVNLVEPEITIDIPESNIKSNQEDPGIAEKNMRNSTLYFVNVSNENEITLQGMLRPVYYDNSPLTETIIALISGLTSSELNKGLLSLIPARTELQGISVSNMTATINFNDALSFNTFGKEGLEAELKQIVYTATEFSTVNKVQILINGQKKQFLSTEGVFIGEPLTRSSLQ